MCRRPAFTLLELLLTLSVLAVIASVVIPQIGLLMGDRELVRAGDQVRVEMTRLRVEAMRSGRVMMLQAMTNGKTIRKQPYFSASDATEAVDQTGSQSALLSGADQGSVAVVQEEPQSEEVIELAGDVTIAAVAVVATARAAEIEQLSLGQQAEGWSRPILFYPDGRTSTASLTVTSESIGRVQINIRGITGDVTISEVLP